MLQILYENRDIVCVLKPVGISSQSDERRENDMVSLLREGRGEIYPLHRLDMAVGGVMVYAKNKNAAARISSVIAGNGKRGDDFSKEYLAIVRGSLEESEGRLCDLLFHDRAKNKTFVVDRERRGVKQAELLYRVIGSAERDGETYSLVSVKLITGRTHQIRVQFASRGHALVGDRRYGARDTFSNIGLWSRRITLTLGGRSRSFEAEPQGEMWEMFSETGSKDLEI